MAKVSKIVKEKSSVSKIKDVVRKRKLRRKKAIINEKELCKERGVVYINHVPHGFYEKEMFEYFKQFGKVTAVKIPRSKKTGRSKGFAFVEFQDKDVANVAADAMNNYLMFNSLIQTTYIPPEKQKPLMFNRKGEPWKNPNPKGAADKRRENERKLKNRVVRDLDGFQKKMKNNVERLHKKLLKTTGIDYEFQVDDKVELKAIKSTEENFAKPSSSLEDDDESDDDIRLRKPPNTISRALKTSQTKLNAAKTKTTKVVSKKAALVKSKAGKVIKQSVGKLSQPKKTNKKVVKEKTSSLSKKAIKVKTQTEELIKKKVKKLIKPTVKDNTKRAKRLNKVAQAEEVIKKVKKMIKPASKDNTKRLVKVKRK